MERGRGTMLLAGHRTVRRYFQIETSAVEIQQLWGTKTLLTDYASYLPVQPQLPRRDKARDSSFHLWKCWRNLNHPLPPQQLTEMALPTESRHL